MRKDQGFTIIELVIVIVILGILAAVAIPQYIDLTGDADTSAVTSVAGSLTSANAINYAARTENSAKGIAITDCTSLSGALTAGLPSGYVITAAAIAAGTVASCTLTYTPANGGTPVTATFTATGIT